MKKYVNDQLVDMTSDEIAERQAEEQAWADGAAERDLSALRKERYDRLAETDWWASSDLTMTDAQKKYRQDLRDITKSATSLNDVTWPTKP
tara:strand:- start:260 stop:532 length:273 start_codon:yes stop_codon:yes gene_type:complete